MILIDLITLIIYGEMYTYVTRIYVIITIYTNTRHWKSDKKQIYNFIIEEYF
jgi:hypothetical protein